jgi:hypothetical protein
MYTIKEEREITPVTFAHLVSSTLYERRFGPYFIEPVVAGLDPLPTPEGQPDAPKRFKPFIASMDLIGCINWAKVRFAKTSGRREKGWLMGWTGLCGFRNGVGEAVWYGGRSLGAGPVRAVRIFDSAVQY